MSTIIGIKISIISWFVIDWCEWVFKSVITGMNDLLQSYVVY